MQLRHDLELLDRIGENHMTENWKTFQPTLQRTVMVCMLKPDVLADPEAAAAFSLGAKIAARLSHPNVLGIYDAEENTEQCYIVQEYLPGSTLMERLLNGPPIPASEAFSIAAQVAHGLANAWEQERLVHCNLTPRSILLDYDGTAKVSMLGQCQQITDEREHVPPTELVGIPNYMAPERVCGQSGNDFRSDIYSLGTVLYHMLLNKLPFGELEPQEVLQAHLTGHLVWPARPPEHVPPAAVTLLEHMLMRDPEHRPHGWSSVIKSLRRIASGHILVYKKSHSGASTLHIADGDLGKRRRKIIITR